MAIPNTTPTPNELFNGEMKHMSDSELRITLIVTRATFGWIADEKTGLRKEEDWISHSQMVERSGRKRRAVSYAVASCVDKDYIEARTESGELLDTPEKRRGHGRKIFYRLGRRFMGRIKTIANSAMVDEPVQIKTQTSANNAQEPVQKGRTTKETLTKETDTKQDTSRQGPARFSVLGAEIIKEFESVDPKNKNYYGNTTQRNAADFLIAEYGVEEVKKRIGVLPRTNKEPYFPTITTPVQLRDKWVQLQDAVARKRGEIKNKKKIFV